MTAPQGPAADGMQAPFANAGGDQASMAQTAVPTENGNDLAWTVPEGWTQGPDQPMRKATFNTPGNGTLSITAFPGDTGGELANLNRWRGQLKLAPITADQLERNVTRLSVGSLAVTTVSLQGPDGSDLLAAMVPSAGSTWFFKLTAPHASIAALDPQFTAFIGSLRNPNLSWQAPQAWSKLPDQPMRKASYSLANPAGASELAITAFPGDVGGELANLNRWRGQLSLPPLTPDQVEASVKRIRRGDLTLTIVDLQGPAGNDTLGAIVPYAGSTWFFKLTGPHAAVEAQKGAFDQFLQTLAP